MVEASEADLSDERVMAEWGHGCICICPNFRGFHFLGEHVMNKARNENAKGMVHFLFLLCSTQCPVLQGFGFSMIQPV